MYKLSILLLSIVIFTTSCKESQSTNNSTTQEDEGWVDLFNGKDLSGWKANENDSTWSVTDDGILEAIGERSHLYYEGEHLKDGFKNFEIIAMVKTFKLSNSGIYFHTEKEETGWPSIGLEIQVNHSHIGGGDYIELKKYGSLYGYRNLCKSFGQDSVWVELRALVEDKHVQVWLDGLQTVDYIEPANPVAHGIVSGKELHSGTFALQGHDPLSRTHYKSIKVRRLPDDLKTNIAAKVHGAWHDTLLHMQENQFMFIDLNSNANMTADEKVKYFYETGVNTSLVAGIDNLSDLHSDEKLPIFRGIKIDASQVSSLGNASADYVIGESSNMADAKALLSSGKIDIWSNHGAALTTSGAADLLDLAVENNVAIEIDNEAKTPSIDVLKLALEKGCKFTYANLSPASKMENSIYITEAIKGAGIGYKDQFIPMW